MTAGLADHAPVLVLGLGNLLLQDDGLGLKLLEAVEAAAPSGSGIDFTDGGTQGLALLGILDARKLIVVLDAVGLGDAPGTVHLLRGAEIENLGAHRATTAHEGNALELLATARLLGAEPEDLVIIGIEPDQVRTGVGLSEPVSAAIPIAAAIVIQLLRTCGEGDSRACPQKPEQVTCA